jgi:hypothetical protein
VSVVPFGRISANAAVFDVSVERRFLMISPVTDPAQASSPPGIVVVQNWFEELKRLAPRK